ncbi:hypothetical protein QE152_g10111 [Popillia japonica]|uniref:Uncharacterized protein n=1 Tax=Popillia japonica TaxID=7064 RepID=A0AAW1LWG1_POPJA
MKSHQAKSVTWGKIESEFNGVSGEMYRPGEVLKENIKKRVKKSMQRKNVTLVGLVVVLPSNQYLLKSIQRSKKYWALELKADYQSLMVMQRFNTKVAKHKAILMVSPQSHTLKKKYHKITTLSINCFVEHEEDCEPNEVIRLVMVNDDPSTQLDSDENHENYENTKIAEQHGITSRVSQWADDKSQLEVSKNKFLEKEDELKLQFMREKHEVELELMKKKAAHEIQLMEEESGRVEAIQKKKKFVIANILFYFTIIVPVY